MANNNLPPPYSLEKCIKIDMECLDGLIDKLTKKYEDVKNESIKLMTTTIPNNASKADLKTLDNWHTIIQRNINEINVQTEEVNNYETILNTIQPKLDKIKVIMEDARKVNEEVLKHTNNTYLNNRGTLSQLALQTLPKDDAELREQITASLNENESPDVVDTYMTVVDFERNKQNQTKSSGGRRRSKKQRKTRKQRKQKHKK
jgi:hypothetical protein